MPTKVPRLLTADPSRVTERERRIAGLIAQGVSRRNIAVQLGVPLGTVNKDITLLYAKLALPDGKVGLTRWAVTNGWVRGGRRGPARKLRDNA